MSFKVLFLSDVATSSLLLLIDVVFLLLFQGEGSMERSLCESLFCLILKP